MGIDESEVSRLLRGDVPSDDPVLGEVATFLDTVGTVYPAAPTTAFEGRHLAAVARESRLVHAELGHPRRSAVKRMFQGTHRILAGSVGALLVVVTASVGVASALGVNPLDQLMSRIPGLASVAPAATTPSPGGTGDPAGGNKTGEPGTAAPPAVPGSAPGPLPSVPASGSSVGPTTSDQAEKDAEKAQKDAEKADAKAKHDAEKAAEKARKEAEKAKKASAKASPTPRPSPTRSDGKKGDAGGEGP